MAMTVELPAALEQTDPIASRAKSPRLRRYARPALGLLLPVGLALIWELVVWRGWSNGRLLPPPTRVFATIVELARSGELTRHIVATLSRMAAGFGLGVIAGTVLGAISGYWALARRLLEGLEPLAQDAPHNSTPQVACKPPLPLSPCLRRRWRLSRTSASTPSARGPRR